MKAETGQRLLVTMRDDVHGESSSVMCCQTHAQDVPGDAAIADDDCMCEFCPDTAALGQAPKDAS